MKRSKFLAGLLAGIILASLFTTGIATQATKTAELYYRDIKIMFDGKEIVPTTADGTPVEPFIIDGTTYLPVRGIASALGLEVQWDGATGTVILTTPEKAPSSSLAGDYLYEDEYVAISFVGIEPSHYAVLGCRSDAVFMVTNKTAYALTFQSSAIAFDGISYSVQLGSDEVAPNSTGKVRFAFLEEIPSTATATSGVIDVIDFSYQLLEYAYDATWTRA